MFKASMQMKGSAQAPASLLGVLEDLGRRLSCIEAALRKGARAADAEESVFAFGEGRVSRRKFAYISSRRAFVRLSPRELALLEMFADHPNEVLPRDMLLSRLWGIDYYGNTRTLDQHVGRLRQKLGADGMRIVTVSRVGYAYDDGEMALLHA